jgi:hypothetical protein
VEEDQGEERTDDVKIWKGKLILNGERKKPGQEVEARIVLGASVMFEVRIVRPDGWQPDAVETGEWRPCDADEVHADSWLRALGETGTEVG